MKFGKQNSLKPSGIIIICLITLIFSPSSALSEEAYNFERMWPTLEQPWYFYHPSDVAGDTSATLSVADVTAVTGAVAGVWAVVTPPGYGAEGVSVPEPVTFDLTDIGEGRYEGICEECFGFFGTYQAAVYAADDAGNTSLCETTSVYQSAGPDIYEEDDGRDAARVIVIDDEAQNHSLHEAGDEDWVRFYGLAGTVYTIGVTADSPGKILVGLYYEDNIIPQHEKYADEQWDWRCPLDSVYCLRIVNTAGETAAYSLKIYSPVAGLFPGYLKGAVTDSLSAEPVINALVRTDMGASVLSHPPNGGYRMLQEPATDVTITVGADGYEKRSISGLMISEGGSTVTDFGLDPVDTIPVARIDYPPPDKVVYEGEALSFQGSVTDGNEPFSYLWNLNGGEISDEEDPENVIFETAGSYTVIFGVTDGHGDTDETSVTVSVYAEPAAAIVSPLQDESVIQGDSGRCHRRIRGYGLSLELRGRS